MEIITKYFNRLSEQQINRFAMLGPLYEEWNSKINVISRKDISNLYPNHVLHSLAIAKFTDFKAGTEIVDVGTGGGFPGIPLAIMFPEAKFTLIDRTLKKLKVVEAIANAISLTNIDIRQADMSEVKQQFDFAVSRAVMELPLLVKLVKKNISSTQRNSIPNGLICLKGGNLNEEIRLTGRKTERMDISNFFEEDYFTTKQLLYVQL
ncbi:MAG: 16S rRNA (guanine(527)-N(7))-methyltransferase RsmG [Muribaculaceae bacterium]|nr:16S rRNA (guanine(527)-N(7))-methyltransferase RsmG [Muribaculaceae bacterium]MDY5826645.1 16S rRNA (guanine(527)-N(7))-methyltransferase RsmG [Candidatus Limisoma sp.]